jgi:hypothetical protein
MIIDSQSLQNVGEFFFLLFYINKLVGDGTKFAHELFVMCFPKKIIFSRYTSPSYGITHFSAVLCVTTVKRFVRCTWDTQCPLESSLDWVITKYTTNTAACGMLLTLGTCNSPAGADAREFTLHYPGRRHPDGTLSPIMAVALFKLLWHLKRRSLMDYTDTRAWKWHKLQLWNESSVNLRPYCARNGTILTEDTRGTAWPSTVCISLFAERNFVSRRFSCTAI